MRSKPPSRTQAYPWLRGCYAKGKQWRTGSLVDDDEETWTHHDSPFENLYFSEENMNKYEPLAQALKKVNSKPELEGEAKEEAKAELAKAIEEYRDTSWCSNWDYKKYDFVFYGASGYTGYLMMEYLKRQALPHAPEKFTFALAGRSYNKVAAARESLLGGTEYADAPIITASLGTKYEDMVSMIDLCRSARVIINSAGPFFLTPCEILCDCCIYHRTDYIDVAGEVPHILKLNKLHKKACQAGVMICGSSGVAAIPDMGMTVCAKKLKEEYGEEVRYGRSYLKFGGASTRLGSSGGTLATRKALNEADDEVKSAMADPFAFGGFIEDKWCPDITDGQKALVIEDGPDGKELLGKVRAEDKDFNLTLIKYDERLQGWCAPFWFSFFDTRMVRRSNMLYKELGGDGYGPEFNFMEYQMCNSEAAAKKLVQLQNVAEEKEALQKQGKYFEQGQGPAMEDIQEAWMHFRFYAETPSGKSYKWSITGKDGYYETARMAIELALTLRFDRIKLPFKGGCLTSPVAGGDWVTERVCASGLKVTWGDWEPVSGHDFIDQVERAQQAMQGGSPDE